jgi:hypothetical protein
LRPILEDKYLHTSSILEILLTLSSNVENSDNMPDVPKGLRGKLVQDKVDLIHNDIMISVALGSLYVARPFHSAWHIMYVRYLTSTEYV